MSRRDDYSDRARGRDDYRYTFGEKTSLTEVRGALLLAVGAAEWLHGRDQVRLDAAFCLDEKRRTGVVDAATLVGKTIGKIFTGLLRRQCGEEFTVERVVHEDERWRRDL